MAICERHYVALMVNSFIVFSVKNFDSDIPEQKAKKGSSDLLRIKLLSFFQ